MFICVEHGFGSQRPVAYRIDVFLAHDYTIPLTVIGVSSLIVSFRGKVARDIWENGESKTLPLDLWLRAKALLTIMHSTSTLDDLRIQGAPPDIRLHKLKGDRKEYWSVTIRLPWCITFKYQRGDFSEVKIENYH